MHIKIKDQICNYSNSLIESQKLESENILIDENMLTASPALSWINRKDWKRWRKNI